MWKCVEESLYFTEAMQQNHKVQLHSSHKVELTSALRHTVKDTLKTSQRYCLLHGYCIGLQIDPKGFSCCFVHLHKLREAIFDQLNAAFVRVYGLSTHGLHAFI